jgi:hypothetical protein
MIQTYKSEGYLVFKHPSKEFWNIDEIKEFLSKQSFKKFIPSPIALNFEDVCIDEMRCQNRFLRFLIGKNHYYLTLV